MFKMKLERLWGVIIILDSISCNKFIHNIVNVHVLWLLQPGGRGGMGWEGL